MEAATGGAESVAYASERELGRGDGDHGVYWRRRLTSHSTGPTSMEGLAVALNTVTIELLALLFFQIKDALTQRRRFLQVKMASLNKHSVCTENDTVLTPSIFDVSVAVKEDMCQRKCSFGDNTRRLVSILTAVEIKHLHGDAYKCLRCSYILDQPKRLVVFITLGWAMRSLLPSGLPRTDNECLFGYLLHDYHKAPRC